jgi:hypothetical protein
MGKARSAVPILRLFAGLALPALGFERYCKGAAGGSYFAREALQRLGATK